MRSMISTLTVLCLLCWPALGHAAPPSKQPAEQTKPFVYEPLPGIPTIAAADVNFPAQLQQACSTLETLNLRGGRPDVGDPFDSEIRELYEQAKTDLQAKANAVAAAAEAFSKAEAALEQSSRDQQAMKDRAAADEALRAAREALKTANESAEAGIAAHPLTANLAAICEKLRDPSSDVSLDDKDLEMLRKYRDADHFGDLVTLLQYLRTHELHSLGELRGVGVGATAVGLGTSITDKALNGLADFIVKRAKEEAIYALKKDLVNRICGIEWNGEPREDHVAGQFLLDTCKTLTSLSETMSLRAMGTALHGAAVADLQRMPDVTLDYFGTKSCARGDELILARLGYLVYREVQRGRPPVDVLAAIHAMDQLPCEASDATAKCRAGAELARRISGLVYVLPRGVNAFAQLYADAAQNRMQNVMLVGYLLESERQTHTPTRAKFAYTTNEINGVCNVAGRALIAFDHFAQAQQLVEGLEREERDVEGPAVAVAVTLEQRRETIAEVINLLAAGVQETAALFAYVKLPEDVADAVEKRAEMTKPVEHFVLIAKLSSELIVEDWAGVATTTTELLTKIPDVDGKTDPVKKHVLAFLPLIIEVANAESSTEVATAIEAAAAPVGSYRAKYQRFTLSLNAFLGGGFGGEYVSGSGLDGWSGMATGFAPVGLHVAGPFGRDRKTGRRWMHFGGALTVLDLGALTTYRLQAELEDKNPDDGNVADGSTTQWPEVGVAQVFSPGLFGVLGIASTPVVLGAGLSMSPKLRQITNEGTADVRDATALRFLVFLAVDVTLYQFL